MIDPNDAQEIEKYSSCKNHLPSNMSRDMITISCGITKEKNTLPCVMCRLRKLEEDLNTKMESIEALEQCLKDLFEVNAEIGSLPIKSS